MATVPAPGNGNGNGNGNGAQGPDLPITRVFIDDSVYASGQRFRVAGFDNLPPGMTEGEGAVEGEGEGFPEGEPSLGIDVDFCALFDSAFQSAPMNPDGTTEGEGAGGPTPVAEAVATLLRRLDPAVADANGTFFFEPADADLVLNVTGNGILDPANELGLLRRILAEPAFNNGVLRHEDVRAVWEMNRETYREDYLGDLAAAVLDAFYPGLVDLTVGYITLGDGSTMQVGQSATVGTGSFGLAAGITAVFGRFAEEELGIRFDNARLNPNDFFDLPPLGPEGDADGDGFSNADEYRCSIPLACFETPGPDILDRVYTITALDPDIVLNACLEGN